MVRENPQPAAKLAEETASSDAKQPPSAAPTQEVSPSAYAEQLRASPGSMAQVLGQLHQTHGNSFVQLVLAELKQGPGSSDGKPLPRETRAQMEQAFGTDLSGIRVHEDGGAEAAGAEAYASGTDIHFAAGRFDPQSPKGQELIGHEIAHVVQQSQGRASAEVQHKGAGALNGDSGLEREADEAGVRAAQGQQAGIGNVGTLSTAAPTLQRKASVTPVAAGLKSKLEVLGDGTPANPGLSIPALEAYTSKQSDWFTEPSFTAADREAVWTVINLFHFGPHISVALAKLHVGEVAALPVRGVLKSYADGFDPSSERIQLSTPAPTLARALQLGQAMRDLAAFVPGPVLRHIIPESGLDYLITAGKIPDLKVYFEKFRPSLENPGEWPHVERLLKDGIGIYLPLASWVSELHIFTPTTRALLLMNFANKSKAKPVLLVVISALDWNGAFQQGSNVEDSVKDKANLGLVVQGRTLGAVTGLISRIAAEYGRGGKIGQVVLAGHGSDTSMEMSSDHTKATWDGANNRVSYDNQADINSKDDPKKNGTEALIDTILQNLDPLTANLVFAGCLINSHDIDPTKSNLTGEAAEVEKRLRENIKAHPNLADYVRSRMAATGHLAQMSAANASTTFGTFKVEAGKAKLRDDGDPDVGGTKLGYVRTGGEPEGVMRAAIECCGDPSIGIAATTAEMRTRISKLAGSTDHWQTCIRVGFELALHGGGAANVDVAVLADVAHRIRAWSELHGGTPAQRLADSVTKENVSTVFSALLANGRGDDVDAVIHQAWMNFDPSHARQMMAKLETAGMNVDGVKLQLSRTIVDPHLGTLLPITASPNRAQMLLALAIAAEDRPLPPHVREFLRTAAGGPTSRAFPAALRVNSLYPNGEARILERIGLSDKAPPVSDGAVDGNVDVDRDGVNEAHIEPNPHRTLVNADNVMVRAKATSEAKDIGKLAKGTFVSVAGTTRDGTWSMIDFNGKTGFVKTMYLQE